VKKLFTICVKNCTLVDNFDANELKVFPDGGENALVFLFSFSVNSSLFDNTYNCVVVKTGI